MDKELNYYLAKKYPLIFPKKSLENEFYWSFQCDSGWFKLLDNCCSQLQSYIDSNNKHYQEQILYQSYIDDNKLDKLPSWVQLNFEKGEHLSIGKYCSQVVAVQVKEKFGTLRFYYDGGDSYCRGVVSMAETMSGSICEKCGDEGRHVASKSGYVQVLCKKHAKELGFIQGNIYKGEELYVLVSGGYQEMKVIEKISKAEMIAENAQKIKFNVTEKVHDKITYWNGELLESF